MFIKRSSSLIFKSIIIFLFVIAITASFMYRDKVFLHIKYSMAYYYVFKGDKNYRKGLFQNAINDYNYALQLYPNHTKAQYNLGNIYAVFEDFYNAINCYEKALSTEPDYINARINLGIVLQEELHDIDRAINEYINAINAKPFLIKIPFIFDNSKSYKLSKAIAYYNLGLAYKSKALLYSYDPISERSYLMDAADNYKKSLKIESNNYSARYNLALTLHLLKNYSEAQQEYCKAIKIAPLNYDAHYNLAILLKETGRYKDSVKELERAGLILGIEGNIEKTEYIYQILDTTRQKAIIQPEKESAKALACDMQSCEICKNT